MAFKKILVPVIGAQQDRISLSAAFAAAKPFNAHVEALFVHPDPRESVPYVGMPVSPEVIQQIVDSAEEIAQAASKTARATLYVVAKDAGANLVKHPLASKEFVTCCYHEVQGHFITRVGQAARLADLVVFGPATLDSGPDVSGAFIETLAHIQRPVLLSPRQPVRSLTNKIVIGFDGGLAAAHALSAALPYLAVADAVEIFAVQQAPLDNKSLDEAVEYLALHGIAATPRVVDRGALSAGEALLDAATKSGASMLVIGGYGHSRLMETMLGGTTVHLTSHLALPLFMVH
ncbi:MAG TPA: universal stress protein [Rhizomicrobium sp.]|nr:universal stress protein [Rhizomicrobium sp.]